MEKAKDDIKEELLKQLDGDSDGMADVSKTSAREIIEKHKTRLRRQKWIAVTSWLIAIIYALAMHSLKDYLTEQNIEAILTSDELMLLRYSDMGLVVLIVIATLLTYLAYSTSRSTTLLQICARLASIEEHLKKISENV
jgi:uncharacterized membrane protein YdbT with pleckstrin-like domain